MRPSVEPTFHSRFESKYIVDPRVVPEMRRFLTSFTKPDRFAALRAGYRYPVCSLYLDSPDLMLYQQTVSGEKDRFKLRIRTYTDDPSQPAYLEVKRKMNSVVHKRRAGVLREHVRLLLDRRVPDLSWLTPGDRADAEYFYNHLTLIEARPLIRVKYMREAYAADGNEPARITLDTGLMHAITLDDELSHARGRWTSTPVTGVIVEIKFTERFPWWVQDFIQAFSLHQRAVPKYVWSVDHMILDGRETALSVAGITLPPRRSS
jgi:SPX domain protein involved in polyphosphate accumulation